MATIRERYIVDSRGKKTAVILPIKDYERLLEDLFDRRLIDEARGELSLSLDEVEERLRKDGLLPD